MKHVKSTLVRPSTSLPEVLRVKWNVLFACMLSTLAVQAADLISVCPWPDKVLYDVNETATFDVTLKNGSQSPVAGKLKVSVIWEIEDMKVLAEQPIRVGVNETNVVTVKWEKMPEVLGCEAKAEVIGADGKTIAMGSEYFNVCRHLDACRVGIHSCLGPGSYIPIRNQLWRDQIFRQMNLFRQCYINIVEVFPSASDGWNMAPQGAEWLREHWVSKEAVQFGISEMHRYGMKAVLYAVAYTKSTIDDLEITMRHPEWFCYDKSGQPADVCLDVAVEARRRNPRKYEYHPACWGGNSGNYWPKEHVNFHINQLIANQKMFNMDGVRYDGHPGVGNKSLDVFGKKSMLSQDEVLKAQVKLVNTIKQGVRAVCPNYLFMYNCGRAVGLGNPIDLEKGTLAPELAPLAEGGGALCDEEIRNADMSYNDMHAWKDYARCIVSDVDLSRAAGGYAYVIFPYPFMVCRNSTEMGNSILLAGGHHPWFAQPYYYQANEIGGKGTHYPVERELLAFATRFSAMLWGHGINRVREPEKVLDVTCDKGEIWWKWFVQERELKDGRRYLIVHLFNVPSTKEIGVVEQPLAEPIRNVKLQLKVPVKKAWMAVARPGSLRKVKDPSGLVPEYETNDPMSYGLIPVINGLITIPELRVWTMVVIELNSASNDKK